MTHAPEMFRYVVSVSSRKRGSQGAFPFREFLITFPRSAATPAELFDRWLVLFGHHLEPGVMDFINGKPTAGMHGERFDAAGPA